MTSTPPDMPALEEDLQALLAPVPGPEPCGVSIRADALFTDIRLAREEDDPSLPMRQWERPLKKADWPRIEAVCTETLCSRSKDLQLAAWLTEAWMRQDAGVAGLARGLLLLRGLVDGYWANVYPRIDPPEEGGGCEARVAPFEWLDTAMAQTLRVHVCLFPLALHKPDRISLADWERLIAGELTRGRVDPSSAEDESQAPGEDAPPSREDILADVARHQPEVIDERLLHVREARAHLIALSAALDAHLGLQAPSLRRLPAALDAMERVLVQARAALPEHTGAAPGAGRPGRADGSPDSAQGDALPDDALLPPDPSHSGSGLAPVVMGEWRNRDEAYQTLEALAQYLATIEPHSPTPYLVRRAVNWGRLPLPELMAEIMREEGDLNRMVQLLGLSR